MAKKANKRAVREPTAKQVNLAKATLENLGKTNPDSMGKLMRDVGYSDATSKTPKSITDAKSYRELLLEVIPREELMKRHNELMTTKEPRQMPFHYKIKAEHIKRIVESAGFVFLDAKYFMQSAYVHFLAPNDRAVKAGIDMMYKIIGEYAPEKTQLVDPLDGLTVAELNEKLSETEELVKRKKDFEKKAKKPKAKPKAKGK